MAGFGQKLISYLANEIVTKQLAKSKAFQKFAATTHKHVSEAEKKAAPIAQDVFKKAEAKAKELNEKTQPARSSLFQRMKDELSKLENEGKALNKEKK
eukprot:m.74035 g.74035  ORF g.74035 m.74035 type:complete len:98 (+) comp24617_c0_seq1:166-459(+)